MKNYITKNKTKLALYAGATALAALAPQIHAQSSDALIDKLVDKGVLTVDEAKDLRVEADKNFNTALQAKTGMPDWVTSYKIGGDFRGRFEQFSGENKALTDRTRERYRIRFGVTVNMLDNMEVGLRLGSSDATKINNSSVSAGNPNSGNSTMQDNFSKKMVYIDAAYGKWTAVNGGDWLLAATLGKMDNPFTFTPMVFDPDLTPEGAAMTGSYTINDQHSVAFAGAAFVLDEESGNTHDPFMYGGQVVLNSKWNQKLASSLGLGGFEIVSPEQLSVTNVPTVNLGNTRRLTGKYAGSPLYNFNPIIADASVTYTLDNFPLFNGAFPIKLASEFINNPAAPNNNNGYWAGITFGKSGTKKTWDLSYRYEYLEANAWYDQLVDDDNGAFYQHKPGFPSSASGYFGGTNVKGHLIKFNYSFTDSLTFTTSCFINDLIKSSLSQAAGGEPKSSAIHVMADLMWKF